MAPMIGYGATPVTLNMLADPAPANTDAHFCRYAVRVKKTNNQTDIYYHATEV